MKYAFLLGSNAFIVDKPVITSTLDGEQVELLRISSVFTDASKASAGHALVVHSYITSVGGEVVALADNNFGHTEYNVAATNNQIHVTDNSGDTVIDVLQLLPEALHGLSSHVLNELHNIGDAVVIRLRGDFMIGPHRITIDNEKFFIDDNVYAESVQVGHNGIQISSTGVII